MVSDRTGISGIQDSDSGMGGLRLMSRSILLNDEKIKRPLRMRTKELKKRLVQEAEDS